jgi:integrating conjugative element protein (TIGR03757 family)
MTTLQSRLKLEHLRLMLRHLISATSIAIAATGYADSFPKNESINTIEVYAIQSTSVTIPDGFKSITKVLNLDDFQAQQDYVQALVNRAQQYQSNSVLDLIDSPQMQSALDKVSQAAQNITNAWQLNLKRLPSTVINNTYILEGVSDVGQAATRFEHYLNSRGEK